MTDPLPNRSPHEPQARTSLARRLATTTTRLIVIAIVAGGLFTAALNLWQLRQPNLRFPLTEPGGVAPLDAAPPDGLPVSQRVVRGDEAAAREAVVRMGSQILDAALQNPATDGKKLPAQPENAGENTVELARDPGGNWAIEQAGDLPRMILGLSLAGHEPTVVFWGGYDETGPGEWTTWTMLLPLPESEASR